MTIRVRVSKKHQIAVPSEVRRRLGIKSGDQLLFDIRPGYAIVLPEPKAYSDKLRGLHREIWEDVDPASYVSRERDAWET